MNTINILFRLVVFVSLGLCTSHAFTSWRKRTINPVQVKQHIRIGLDILLLSNNKIVRIDFGLSCELRETMGLCGATLRILKYVINHLK